MFKKKLLTALLSISMTIGASAFSQLTVSAANDNSLKNNSTGKRLINGTAVEGWLQHNTKWYYLNTSGNKQTGWLLHNGKWYFLNTGEGDMATGWLLHNGKWYFLDSANGDMHKGWLQHNNKWYYLNGNGTALEGAWVLYNGNWYYLNSDGTMAINTTTPDGFTVGSDGSWTWKSDAESIPKGVTAETVSSSVIQIQWDSVANADYYYVYYSINSNTNFTQIANNDGSKKQFQWAKDFSASFSSIAPDTKVYFKVTAVKDGVESKASTIVSATTLSGVVAMPAGVTATAASSSKINVKWNAVVGADHYNVYYRLSTVKDYSVMQSNSNSTYLSGLKPDTKVYFKVTAVKDGIESADSTIVSATTLSN